MYQKKTISECVPCAMYIFMNMPYIYMNLSLYTG